tara:strand:+ start:343 stop:708 length:366 start_codon:yes stop_codon:yes gene_type:complete
MAIEYKNAVKTISSTGSDQLVYTVPTTTNQQKFTGVVKTFTILNTTGGAGTVDVSILDSSASATIPVKKFTTGEFTAGGMVDAAANGPIVLESADALKINTSVSANVLVSVMEVSDELKGI